MFCCIAHARTIGYCPGIRSGIFHALIIKSRSPVISSINNEMLFAATIFTSRFYGGILYHNYVVTCNEKSVQAYVICSFDG